MFIIIVFRLNSDKIFYLSQWIRHGMWLLSWGKVIIFYFWLFKSIIFFANWISVALSISCIVLTCYVYYYSIWWSFNRDFCFFAGFLLSSPKGSVTGSDSSLGSFCYSPVLHFALMHLLSGYYYSIIGSMHSSLLRPSWLTEVHY